MVWQRPSSSLLHFCWDPCGGHSANWVMQAVTRGRWSGAQHLETREVHKSLARDQQDTSEVLQTIRFIKNWNEEKFWSISRFKTDLNCLTGKYIFFLSEPLDSGPNCCQFGWGVGRVHLPQLLILQMSRSHIYYHSRGKKKAQTKKSPHHPEWCGTEVLGLLKDGVHSREHTWITPLPWNLLIKGNHTKQNNTASLSICIFKHYSLCFKFLLSQ